MTDWEVWEALTGRPLTLGLLVTVNKDSAYAMEWQGKYFITGLEIEKDGRSVNITIGDSLDSRDADGWNIYDLSLAF